MSMKKTWFDKALFRDAFRQLSVSGLIILLIMCMQAVLLPIGIILADRGTARIITNACGVLETDPMVFLLFTCVTPLMAVALFRFLARRNDSDFYHSIPQTRECLFLSFSAAVMAWTVILQFVPMIIGTVIHLAFPSHFSIDWKALLTGNLMLLIAEFMVLSAVLLGITVTGSILTNLIVSLLIIFFPRVVMMVLKLSIGGSLTIVSDHYLSLMGNGWNLVTSLVMGVFGEGINVLYSFTAGAYTFVLALVYYLLALGMFVKRKSEAAGEASVHPVLQLVFRLLPATAYCLAPTVMAFSYIVDRTNTVQADEWYVVFVLYLIGIVLYFIYELVTTRKVRNLAKAAPGLVILAGIQIVILFGMIGLRSSLISYQPEASEIESVSFMPDSTYMWDDSNTGAVLSGYLTGKVAGVELTDDHLKEIISVRLKESAAYDKYPKQRSEADNEYFGKQVMIVSGGRKHYRVLHLKQTDIAEMAAVLKDQKEIRDIYMNLPKADGRDVRITLINSMVSNQTMSAEAAAEAYAALQQDVQDMGFESWYEFCSNEMDYSTQFYRLYLRCREGNEWSGSVFPIGERTPKALAVCMSHTYETQKPDIQAAAEMIRDLDERYAEGQKIEITYSNVFVSEYNAKGAYVKDDVFNIADEKARKSLLELLERQNGKPAADGSYMMLTIDFEWAVSDAVNTEAYDPVRDTESLHTVNYFLILDENGLKGIDPAVFGTEG